MINVYGLKNCDTCRKALKWMDAKDINYIFVDLRKDGVSSGQIADWAKAVGWEVLLNKRGTTWRAFDDATKLGVDEGKAIKLMALHPAVIKRPVFVLAEKIVVGFSAETQSFLIG